MLLSFPLSCQFSQHLWKQSFLPDVKKNDSLFESTVHGVSEEDESSLLADEEEDVGEEMTDDGLLKKMMRIGVSYF